MNKENKVQRAKAVIKDVQQQKFEYGVNTSFSTKREKLILTSVTIVYDGKKRKPLELSLSGELVGFGPDYFIMQGDEHYTVYDEAANELVIIPLVTGELRGCAVNGFKLKKPDGLVYGFNRTGNELGVVQAETAPKPTPKAKNLIRNFWLESPNGMTGMFWIRYATDENNTCQYPVFLSVRDLYRLFAIEGIDPLVVDETDDKGYYFSTAILENRGAFAIETTDEEEDMVCITITAVAPYLG